MVFSYCGIAFSSDWCHEFEMDKMSTDEWNAIHAQGVKARQTSTNDDQQSDSMLAASQAAIKEQIMQHTPQTSRLLLGDENQASTTADDEDNSGTPSLFEMPSQVLRRGSDGNMLVVNQEGQFSNSDLNREYFVLDDLRKNSSERDNGAASGDEKVVNSTLSGPDAKSDLVRFVVPKSSENGSEEGEQVLFVHPANLALREQAAERCALFDYQREREERMIRLNEEAQQRLLFERAHDGTSTAPIAKKMYQEQYGPLAGSSTTVSTRLAHDQLLAAAQQEYDDTTNRTENTSAASSQERENESGVVTPPFLTRNCKKPYVSSAHADDSDDEERRFLQSQKVLSRKEESLGAFSESGRPGDRVLDVLSRPTPFTCQITRTTVTAGGCAYEENNMSLAQYQEQHPLTIERIIARKQEELTQLKAQLKKDKQTTDESDSADVHERLCCYDPASIGSDYQDDPNSFINQALKSSLIADEREAASEYKTVSTKTDLIRFILEHVGVALSEDNMNDFVKRYLHTGAGTGIQYGSYTEQTLAAIKRKPLAFIWFLDQQEEQAQMTGFKEPYVNLGPLGQGYVSNIEHFKQRMAAQTKALEEAENRAKVAFIEAGNTCDALKVKTKEVEDLLQELKQKDDTIKLHQIVAHWVALTNERRSRNERYKVNWAHACFYTKKQKAIEGLEQKLKENTADFTHQMAALEDLYKEQAATKEKDFTSANKALQLQVSGALANAQDLQKINKVLQRGNETKDTTIASLSAENTKLEKNVFMLKAEISALKKGYTDGSLLFEV